jgi:vancomycin resistance protein YoaR
MYIKSSLREFPVGPEGMNKFIEKAGMGKMRRKTRGIFILLISFFIVLAVGCSEETAIEGKLGGGTQETNEEVEEKNGENENVEQKEEPAPITIEVIDPVSKVIIRTIIPKEMGFGIEDEQYKKDLSEWAKELARGTDLSPGYDQRNTPDRIDGNGQVIKGEPRVILEEAELVESILQASDKGGKVELPLYITESDYKPVDVAHLNEVVVASYTTYFEPNAVGRNTNIELSAQAIDNVIVGVNDHFSFNTTVGPSDEAHGYQPALEAINGELVMGIGGGICQTSSTLFNAVDQLAVDYVEWHHHSVTVGYVPTGRDATVSYGGKDFRFLNTTDAPFLIKSIYGNGSLTVEVRTAKQYEEILKKS